MQPNRRKPARPASRRSALPPPVPVVSPGTAKPEKPAPVEQPALASETDQTEEQIRKMLEAAYT